MTTKEVFEKIISKRAWYHDLGIEPSNGKSIAKRYRDGKLSLDKIEEVIQKAGYHVIQEKQWGK